MKRIILILIFTCYNICIFAIPSSKGREINLPYVNKREKIDLPDVIKLEILNYLNTTDTDGGKYSNINIEYAYIDWIQEMSNYSTEWYGEIIPIKQFGILVSYKYNKKNTIKEDCKHPFHSNVRSSTCFLFFPNKENKIWCYTIGCFGVPPTCGSSSTWIDLDEKRAHIINLIRFTLQ
jgi:hypothetical protein